MQPTIENTNGTVWLSINNVNYTATNYSANVYNLSVSLTSAGTYNYTWNAYGNGTNNLFNSSEMRYYTIQQTTNTTENPQQSSGSGGSYILEQKTEADGLKIKTWISPNTSVTIKIKQDKGTGIREIELKSKNWLSGEIYIVGYNETPDFCSIEYPEKYKVYKVIDFDYTIKNNTLASGRLRVGISKDWIYLNNISEIKVVRCYPEYQEVKSSYKDETNEEGVYDIYLTGFSAYAIVGTLASNNSSKDEQTIWNKPLPNSVVKILLLLFVIIILIGLISLLIKHRIYLKEKIHSKFFDFEFRFRLGRK